MTDRVDNANTGLEPVKQQHLDFVTQWYRKSGVMSLRGALASDPRVQMLAAYDATHPTL